MIDKALEAMNYAYAPYSKFKVGAALITDGVVIPVAILKIVLLELQFVQKDVQFQKQ